MFRKIVTIFTLILLNGCATSGSALLGPIFTGAKTGSVYQASISYSSGKIMNQLIPSETIFKNNVNFKSKNTLDSDVINVSHNPIIISSYKVDLVSFSNVIEPELWFNNI